jgi:hypothetical protein
MTKMLFELRLFAYRLLKPFMWPVSRLVAIPASHGIRRPDSALRLCASMGQLGFRRVMIVTDAVLVAADRRADPTGTRCARHRCGDP